MKALAALPLTGYVALVGFALYSTWLTGHWPAYNHPDPKSLPFGSTAIYLLALAALLAVAVFPLVQSARRIGARRKNRSFISIPRGALIAYAVGAGFWSLELLRAFADRGLIIWLID